MTLYCKHRVNDPAMLAALDTKYGVEIDLRSDGGHLILEHDPFTKGPRFSDWLDQYNHAFIVLNIKEEGLESRVIAELEARGIQAWAFLDQSFPFLVRLLRTNETRAMVRISEFESAQTAVSLRPKPQWIWVDSFSGTWPTPETLTQLSNHGFKFMLVSPELQGRALEEEITQVHETFHTAGVKIDAVCTKRPEVWEQQLCCES